MTERFPYALIAVLAIVIIALAGISFTISPFFAGAGNEGNLDIIILDGTCDRTTGTADFLITARDSSDPVELDVFVTYRSGTNEEVIKVPQRYFLDGTGDFNIPFDRTKEIETITVREKITGAADLRYC